MKRYRFKGTIFVLAGLAVAVGYSAWTAPQGPQRKVLEAGADGRLREVSSPSASSQPLPPLFKPEPSLLLEHGNALKLGPKVRMEIESLDAKWQTERMDLQARLDDATPKIEPNSKSSIAVLNSELADYSEVSRVYGAARERWWNLAFGLLEPKQQAHFRRMIQRGEEIEP